jgi:hypothetical protein
MKKLKNIINEESEIEEKYRRENEALKSSQKLHESLSDHYKNFTEDHIDNIKKYTDDSYGINSYLWKKHKGEEITEEDKHYALKHSSPKIEKMDSALKAHKTPYDLEVHSGTDHDPRELKNSEGIMHHPAYLSTSLMHNKATDFAGVGKDGNKHVLSINVPKGSHGAYVENHSYSPNEREFIIPRDSKLKHISTDVETRKHSIYGHIKIHTHNMDLV